MPAGRLGGQGGPTLIDLLQTGARVNNETFPGGLKLNVGASYVHEVLRCYLLDCTSMHCMISWSSYDMFRALPHPRQDPHIDKCNHDVLYYCFMTVCKFQVIHLLRSAVGFILSCSLCSLHPFCSTKFN